MKKICSYILSIFIAINASSVTFAMQEKAIGQVKSVKGTSRILSKGKIMGYTQSKHRKKLNVISKGAVLMNSNNGEILYSKNIHKKLYPASTTKILTAIVAIESGKLDKYITVGVNPPVVEPFKIYLKKGEKVKVRELLYALMLESANDSALALAEGIGGSQKGFAKMMNEKAKKLGCKESNFVNPNGLPDDKHYTTAYDLAIITKYAMKNSEFAKIIGTKTYTMKNTNKSKARDLTNHNKMMFSKNVFP